MKYCYGCKDILPKDKFSKNKRKPDGLDTYCKSCTKVRSAAHHQKNKEKRRAQVIAWLAANPGKNSEYAMRWREKYPGAQQASWRKWYDANRETVLAKDKSQREANIEDFLRKERESYYRTKPARAARHARWRAANPHKVCSYAAARRSAKIRRTPKWLSDEQLREIETAYLNAAFFTKYTGEVYHVDHIVPLRGVTVSGLHVPWNLQILSATENLSKNNRVWPDMP